MQVDYLNQVAHLQFHAVGQCGVAVHKIIGGESVGAVGADFQGGLRLLA